MGDAGGTDALDRYLEEIGRHPVLDRADEARLARRYREDGDEAALAALVTANLRFVVSVAKRYRGRGVAFEDLVNEGNVGLMRAARRFDERHGVRLVTYAAWWIRQAILAAVSASRPPPVPPPSRRRAGRTEAVREPDPGSRAGPGLRLVSLDGGPAGDGRRPLLERVADAAAEDPERRLDRTALRHALATGMAFLPEREERVLRCYFGLEGGSPRSLARIGREMGLSRERIRQLKDRALDRLRAGPHGPSLEQFVR